VNHKHEFCDCLSSLYIKEMAAY